MFNDLDDDKSGCIEFVEFYKVIIVTELSLQDKVMDMVFHGGIKGPKYVFFVLKLSLLLNIVATPLPFISSY